MSRFFTLDEARTQLPRAAQAVRDGIQAKEKYQSAETDLQELLQRITLLGGLHVDRNWVTEQRAVKQNSENRLRSAVETLEQIGCLLKDLDIGLLDFPTLYHGEEVYLCWKLGEEDIYFWHSMRDGMAGRKPIDSEFIANHRAGNQ